LRGLGLVLADEARFGLDFGVRAGLVLSRAD
jgi:hypothetical protein